MTALAVVVALPMLLGAAGIYITARLIAADQQTRNHH